MLCQLLNSSIWSLDGTLTGPTTPGLGGPGGNGNKGVLHISQKTNSKALVSSGLVLYPKHLLKEGLTPLQRCSLLFFFTLKIDQLLIFFIRSTKAKFESNNDNFLSFYNINN